MLLVVVRTKRAKITRSILILLGALVALGLFAGSLSYSDPPGPPPWQSDPAFLLPFVFLPVLWIAAKSWYSLPVFFGYGAFVLLPFGWAIFGPHTHHGFLDPVPPTAVEQTFAFCVGGGWFAAFVGFLSCVHSDRFPPHLTTRSR